MTNSGGRRNHSYRVAATNRRDFAGGRETGTYKIDQATGCWNWTKTVGRNGYGVQHTKTGSTPAHRHVYQQIKGPIPAGLELDHLCRNKRCVNPEHLEPVSHSENMRRHERTTERVTSGLCKYGHPLDGMRSREAGGRYCKTCVALNKRRQRAQRGGQ